MDKKSIHKGLRTYRLNDDSPSGMRENAFAEQWQDDQDRGLLGHILGTNNRQVTYQKSRKAPSFRWGMDSEASSAGPVF